MKINFQIEISFGGCGSGEEEDGLMEREREMVIDR